MITLFSQLGCMRLPRPVSLILGRTFCGIVSQRRFGSTHQHVSGYMNSIFCFWRASSAYDDQLLESVQRESITCRSRVLVENGHMNRTTPDSAKGPCQMPTRWPIILRYKPYPASHPVHPRPLRGGNNHPNKSFLQMKDARKTSPFQGILVRGHPNMHPVVGEYI